MSRLYCNTCRRFVSRQDNKQTFLEKNPPHKNHELVWIDLPLNFEGLINDEVNKILSNINPKKLLEENTQK